MEFGGQMYTQVDLPRGKSSVGNEWEAGWGTEPVWTLGKGYTSLAFSGNSSVVQPVNLRTFVKFRRILCC
jgi:hypothetical protein